MPRLRTAVLLALAGGAVACGARSELDAATAGGGAGDASSTSASASSGAGGGGGVVEPPRCGSLVQVEPVVALAPTFSGGDQDGLRLAPLRGAGDEVAIVLVARAPGGQLIVHHAALAPWTSWPGDGVLAPVHATFEVVTSGPVAAASATPGAYAMTAEVLGALHFYGAVDPHVEGTGTVQSIGIGGGGPEFLAARAAGLDGPTHLAGAFSDDGTIRARAVGPDGAGPATALGCAAVQPPRAAAVQWGDGWIVVDSSGAPFGACPTPQPDYPTRIDVLRFGADSASLLASATTGTVVGLAAAPHPDGAFIVWTDHDVGASTLRAARFTIDPPAIVAEVALTPPDDSGTSFVVASTGRRLAVARRGAPAEIVVSVYDESLAELASASVAAGGFVGPTSIVAAPGGEGFVIAWTAQEEHPWHGAMARLDCRP